MFSVHDKEPSSNKNIIQSVKITSVVTRRILSYFEKINNCFCFIFLCITEVCLFMLNL